MHEKSSPPARPSYELRAFEFGPAKLFLAGDLDPALVRSFLSQWVKLFHAGGGWLTPEQLTDLLDRAETLAKRLEGVDASTP